MVKIFISYAREDEKYKDELELRLKPFKMNGNIESWNDREILPGADWDENIKSQIENANVMLFLISPNFIGSDYINAVEIKRALERHQEKEVIIIPIIIRHSDFSFLKISKFQALPKDGKPISSWPDKDEAWYNVSLGLKKVFASINDGKIILKKNEIKEDKDSKDGENIKSQIQTLVSKSKIDQALESLLAFAKSTKDDDLFNSVILLSSRYNNLKKSERQRIISSGDADVSRAQITHGLLSLLDEI